MINEPWIQTYLGKKFTPFNPNPDDIDIVDIAHALSNLCRFTGHSNKFYSVAQHSVFVSSLLGDEHKLQGLLHDSSEAFLNDISTPLKMSSVFSAYREVEDRLSKAIYKKFGLQEVEAIDVKIADKIALATEANNFLNIRPDWILQEKPLNIVISPLAPAEAKQLFLDTYKNLIKI